MSNEAYTVKQATEKAMRFCAYQERCQSEVRKKLQTFSLTQNEIEEVIYNLIQENFLNEERYAKAYARGKFRSNKWGKNKIQQALAAKEVSPYCITSGLNEIDSEEYQEALQAMATKQLEKNAHLDDFKKSAKTAQYLISKGFEPNFVWQTIKTITND